MNALENSSNFKAVAGEVFAWTKYEWGAAIQADIRIFKAEDGFIARASRQREIFGIGSTINEASEKAKRAVEEFVVKHGTLWRDAAPDDDSEDEPYVERHMYIIERSSQSLQALQLAERIDSIFSDHMMSPEEVEAYHRASTLPILQRKPKGVQPQ